VIIKPLGSHVLLSPPLRAVLRPTICIPEQYLDPRVGPQYRVLAVGPGRRNHKGIVLPPEVQAGDFVLLDGSRDYQTLYDGRLVVDESQLLAKWSGQQ